MRRLALATAAILVVTGCTGALRGSASTATAELRNSRGETVGTAILTDVTGGVRVVVEVKGLTPGEHGVHVHEVGMCDPPGFTGAGGHFNPEGKQHGLQNPAGPHAGDLPNMTVTAAGTGRLETTTNRISLGAGPTSIFDGDGSALVVHAAPDDLRSDPTGNSGGRVACGILVKK
jgi:Cu-Zn family superoxide dismutase